MYFFTFSLQIVQQLLFEQVPEKFSQLFFLWLGEGPAPKGYFHGVHEIVQRNQVGHIKQNNLLL